MADVRTDYAVVVAVKRLADEAHEVLNEPITEDSFTATSSPETARQQGPTDCSVDSGEDVHRYPPAHSLVGANTRLG